jgi:hypothetical protein
MALALTIEVVILPTKDGTVPKHCTGAEYEQGEYREGVAVPSDASWHTEELAVMGTLFRRGYIPGTVRYRWWSGTKWNMNEDHNGKEWHELPRWEGSNGKPFEAGARRWSCECEGCREGRGEQPSAVLDADIKPLSRRKAARVMGLLATLHTRGSNGTQ